MNPFSTLRGRVWLLVALVAVPLFVYSIVVYLEQREEAMARVEQDFQSLVHSALVEEKYFATHTRELLRIMANSAEMQRLDGGECSGLARRLLQTQGGYLTFGAVLPDGRLFCTARPSAEPINYSDRPWFQEVMAHKDDSRGYYLLSRVAKAYGIVFAHPVLDREGRVRAVVYATTGLDWLSNMAFASKLPAGWAVAILAPDGKPLFQQPPGSVGPGQFPAEQLASFLRAHPEGGMRELAGPDGEPHLYGVASLRFTGDDLHLVIGASKATVLAGVERDFLRHVLLLVLLSFLSMLIGQQAIARSFVRWAEHLHGNIRRIGAGERKLRLEEGSSIRELREIDAAVNAMQERIDTSEEHLGLALESAFLGTWNWNILKGRHSCNGRFAEILGYLPDECDLSVDPWGQWLHPEDMERVRAVFDRHLTGKTAVFECECRLRHKDGHWIWVLAHGRVLDRDEAGEPVRMGGTILNVSGRKLMEEQLRERTEELIALMETMPARVWISRDPDGRDMLGNTAASALGREQDEGGMVGVPAVRCFGPDGEEYLNEDLPVRRAAREGRPVDSCEFEMRFPDGRSLWLWGSAMPLFGEYGEVRGAIGAFVDVSRYKASEEALRRNKRELAQAGHIANLGAWSIEMRDVVDLRANPMHWSDEMYRLLGYETGEVTPSIDLFWQHVHPENREFLLDEAMRAMAERRPLSGEYRIVRCDGTERIVMERAEFRYSTRGRPTYFFGAIQDITERKQAENELRRHRAQLEGLVAERTYELAVAKEAAERANRIKSQFLAKITHELRTPLNSLVLMARVLSDNSWDNLLPQQIEYARMIELSGHDLMHLIDELLDLAKIETGRLAIDIRPVPFPDIMQNVHRTHRPAAKQKGLGFKMEIDADVPAAIVTDPVRLQQLLSNLISNAVKFTHDGGVTLRIRRAVSGWHYGNPALAHAESVVAFDIVDTGVGIEPMVQRHIQDALEQGGREAATADDGIGLGLAISREMASLLGGELKLSSLPGQGSTFTVYLPLVYAGPAMPADTAAVAKVAPPAASGRSDPLLAAKTVVVMDSDQISRMALATTLQEWGIRVLDATSGAEVLELLSRNTQIDAIVMDAAMTPLDGYQTTRAIREDLGQTHLPVIALTADAQSGRRADYLAAGYSDCLAKPVDGGQLIACLRRWLEPAAVTV